MSKEIVKPQANASFQLYKDSKEKAVAYKVGFVHAFLTAYTNNLRQITAKQKSRADVSTTGKKPWKQKGSGRARAGNGKSSPLFVGGGVPFASRPKLNKIKINKKEYKLGMRMILSEQARNQAVFTVDDKFLNFKDISTKNAVKFIDELENRKKNEKILIIMEDNIPENLYLSMRNLYYIALTNVRGIDPKTCFQADKIIIANSAIKSIEAMLV